jgi:hypothetical protein
MKITICGSMRFFREMKSAKEKLEKQGIEVLTPPLLDFHEYKKELGEKKYFEMKKNFTMQHFERIQKSDAILVLNYDKDGKKNYLGGAVLMELAVAFFLNKKIFLLNDVPKDLSYSEEIIALRPIVLNEKLENLKEKELTECKSH